MVVSGFSWGRNQVKVASAARFPNCSAVTSWSTVLLKEAASPETAFCFGAPAGVHGGNQPITGLNVTRLDYRNSGSRSYAARRQAMKNPSTIRRTPKAIGVRSILNTCSKFSAGNRRGATRRVSCRARGNFSRSRARRRRAGSWARRCRGRVGRRCAIWFFVSRGGAHATGRSGLKPASRKWRSVVSASARPSSRMTTKLVQSVKE